MTSISSINNARYDLKLYSGLQSGVQSGMNTTESSGPQGSGLLSGGSESVDGNSALSQLLSALISMSLNMAQSSGSSETSAENGDEARQDRLSELDADADGVLSKTEFLAGKPDDVTDDMATNLFNHLDADGDGSISAEEYDSGDPAANRAVGPPPPTDMVSDQTDEGSTDALDALDTNGDGEISEAEFLAGRPEDVSDEMAVNLFANFDSDGDGVISVDELAVMKERWPTEPISAGQWDDSDQTIIDLSDVNLKLEEVLKAYALLNGDELTETTASESDSKSLQ
ncbi:EF-hand domain-containing protein [Rhizobium sp. SL86]|uniref:EF-hand domain-containing protein n=1 Tax=Rhizobium sp. SL86 TaxID=2995148 RepID=UPI002272CBD6|nr:EF-hand domain-containing protein [Rhizobium sp. SL86]MCY1667736.1 EF-hand domain-containing protein [Rhizobium sp. SL86]